MHRYGYQLIFAGVFLEAMGFPLPAALILLTGGAMSAVGHLKIYGVILTAIGGLLLGDLVMYYLGKFSGWTILKVICSLSMSPETCIIKSATSFYRRGKTTLLFSKFVPGVNSVAAPLAGTLKMRVSQFIGYDLLGASFYAALYSLLGYLFNRELAKIGHGLSTAQRVVTWVIVAGVGTYAAYRWRIYLKSRLYQAVPRVDVKELQGKIQAEADRVMVCDVRSHGYYEDNAQRIAGSTRLEPAAIEQLIHTLPRHKELYLYCT